MLLGERILEYLHFTKEEMKPVRITVTSHWIIYKVFSKATQFCSGWCWLSVVRSSVKCIWVFLTPRVVAALAEHHPLCVRTQKYGALTLNPEFPETL